MALVESKPVPLNSLLPTFELADASGKTYSSKNIFGAKGLLVAFTCNHCPYAIAIWPRLIELAKNSLQLGINTVAINPNINPDYPEDAPDKMLLKIKEWAIPFPYLVDASQSVAKQFDAQCTPDLYLYDSSQSLVYHGRLDDNWKEPSKVKHHELANAVTALANNQKINPEQYPSMGCSIKWL